MLLNWLVKRFKYCRLINFMKIGKTLSTIAALGTLALAGCHQRPDVESPRTGKLDSGLRYTTWTKHGSSRDYNNRVIAFSNGVNVELIDHDGTATLAGDYLQTFDIKIDEKLLLSNEEFERFCNPN